MTIKTKSDDTVEQDTRKTLTWDIIITHFAFGCSKADGARGWRHRGLTGTGALGTRRRPSAGRITAPRVPRGASGKGPVLCPLSAPRAAPGEPQPLRAEPTAGAARPPHRAPPGTAVWVSREVRCHGAPCAYRRRRTGGKYREVSWRGLGGSGVAPGLVWPGIVVSALRLLRRGGPWSSWSESSTGYGPCQHFLL